MTVPDRDSADTILTRLRQPGASVSDLLEEYGCERYKDLWESDVRLYRAFSQRLISAGRPARAFELIRAGLAVKAHRDDLELTYWLALAFARGGNLVQSDFQLRKLEAARDMPPALASETLSLRGRYYKGLYLNVGTGASTETARRQYARLSAEWYERAFQVCGEPFPLINYATMSLLAGDDAEARKAAEQVLQLVDARNGDPAHVNDYWLPAMRSEAEFVLGRGEKGLASLLETVALAGDNSGDINSLRRNLALLRNVALSEELWQQVQRCCNFGSVLVFAGHLIDPHGGYRGRFPPRRDLERAVEEAVRQVIEESHATVGYCSASCGADLIFAEQLLARGRAELHVVLPFRKEDFLRTNVDYDLPEMRHWRTRFESVLSKARQVHHATTEPYLGDDLLFRFFNTMLHGLALTRAEERGVEAEAVVLVDPTTEEPSTMRDFRESWERAGGRVRRIDLSTLRIGEELTEVPERLPVPVTPAVQRPERTVKVMLFAGLKGHSKPEENIPPFFDHFLKAVNAGLKGSRTRPGFLNTWGEGVFMVFNDAVEAAEAALRLLAEVRPSEWDLPGQGKTEAGEENLSLRIGLHAGPVYRFHDPNLDRDNYFGSDMTRAARIEPLTTPGCAYTSEQFAAALAVRREHDFACEFVGTEDLARGQDRCPLYRLTRK